MADIRNMIIGRIDRQEGRTLLYESPEPTHDRWGEYHVIAKEDCDVKAGDTIQYEPFGMNFGWHVESKPE